MKKISFFVLAILVSMYSLTTWAAEREAPTMPAGEVPISGQTYYLYNVDANLFLSSYNSIGWSPLNVLVTIKDNDVFLFKNGSSNNYIGKTSNGNMTTWNSDTDSDNYWSVTESENGYTIQCSPLNTSHYEVDQFLGTVEESTTLKYNCTLEDWIHWKFFTIEDGLRYRAELRLYNALNTIEAYGKEWYIENYKALYDDRDNQTISDLWAAAMALEKSTGMSSGYQAPWWNERPILFYTADGNFGESRYTTWSLSNHPTFFEREINGNGQSSISATVLVEEPSTLVYGLNGYDEWFIVYVDGVEVRRLQQQQYYKYPSDKTHTRFFEELEPGLHTITWTASRNSTSSYDYFYLYNVGVMSKPQISVNLLEPGSLGTEVLYNTDHIKNVRRLKVKGAMNSDDWGRIKMMSTLLELDLSEAQFTEIPANQFKVGYSDTTMNFLHKVVLPEGLTKINDYAFYYSFVEDINLPSTMKRVGNYAFAYSHVKELIMPDDMTDFYGGSDDGYCFEYMYWLKRLVMPKNLTRIPRGTFYDCHFITEAVMPEKLQTVGRYAFEGCYRMQTTLPEGMKTIEEYGFNNCGALNSPLPSTLTTIGRNAFQYAHGYKSLVIPESVTSIGEYAFANCTNMETLELGVYQYSLANSVFQDCGKLKTVKLKSPTVVTINSNSNYYPLSNITTVTLQVPHYLVNEYKLHSYWYNAAAIEPFDYSSTEFIPIHGKLTLNHERFGGQPSVNIYNYNSYLKVNGEDAQSFNNFSLWRDYNDSYGYGMMLSNCPNLSIEGSCRVVYKTNAKEWKFIYLPFDLDVSQISFSEGNVQYAIRYYDGAGRAANGKSGNWKNVDRTSIIPSGTGFILQTNVDCWTSLYSADNESKQNMVACDEFNKVLEVNASETASNKGWNLVGNPYQCFYNNHCLNFTAPITIWNGSTYTAYSLTDDDYAIRPNEAFFVQCPNEEYNTIGFPLQGRQLTSVIESQNAARELTSEKQTRQVVNLTISDGEWEDQTRVVLNEEASMLYEISCDASKFMSMDNSVPQLYTIDEEGTWYAINERPLAEGTVTLGFYAGQDGEYTISVTRCDAEKVFITDNLTGETVDITSGAYTFSAKAGTDNTRFTLSFVSSETTGVKEISKAAIVPETEVYSVDGKFMGTDASRLGTGIYLIRQGKKVSKIVVR